MKIKLQKVYTFFVIAISIFSTISCAETSKILNKNSGKSEDESIEHKAHLLDQERETHQSAEIHSSFSEEVEVQGISSSSQPAFGESSFLKNIPVAPEFSETAEAVVFTLVDNAAAELQKKANEEPSLQDVLINHTSQEFNSFDAEESYVVRAEPKTQVQSDDVEVMQKTWNQSEPILLSSQEETTKTAPQHEDIPSFREWTQKQLAEAERKKVDQNATTDKVIKSSGKFRNKNYASPDCGAKIVAANQESVSSSSVLSSSKDEYMLNYCTSRIWFVVELCEAILAKQLDLANFELFSSSPKHFQVSIASRFPTREWSSIGKFTAKDSRDIQTFDLNPHLFGKYIKVELRSHYGKEHFCPVSWVGVFGTSEYEVLAKEDERHPPQPDDEDDEDVELFPGQRRDAPRNLFSSATDAVLSIVKKATAPFMKAGNNETQIHNLEDTAMSEEGRCVSPRYIIVCDNCSQNLYDDVYYILSCRQQSMSHLISSPFIRKTLINSESCRKYGLDFNSLRTGALFPAKIGSGLRKDVNYLTAMLKDSYVAALCNELAVSKSKVVVNSTIDVLQTLKNLTEKKELCDGVGSSVTVPSTLCTSDCQPSSSINPDYSTSSHLLNVHKLSESLAEKIKPTKTLTKDEVDNLSASNTYPNENSKEWVEAKPTDSSTLIVTPTAVVNQDSLTLNEEVTSKDESKVTFVEKKNEDKSQNFEDKGSLQDSTLESILSDIDEFEKAVKSNPASSTLTPSTNLPTESIFLRLANRIKNLEINMSISSSYLEEMSRRYRNQLEALSKTVNATAQRVEEQYKFEEERERKREKEIVQIRMQLANLTRDVGILLRERSSWRLRFSNVSQHMILVFIEILIVWTIFSFWRRFGEGKNSSKTNESIKKINKKFKRRNSIQAIGEHESPQRKIRRPSDEALEIAVTGKYNSGLLKIEKKRKRKKKDSKSSINVIHVKRKKSENSVESIESPLGKSNTAIVPEDFEKSVIQGLEFDYLEVKNRFGCISSPEAKHSDPECYTTNGTTNEPFRRFSSPVFMKTAMSARHSRLKPAQYDRESSQESSMSSKLDQESIDYVERSNKGKKITGGFKKYMKKFF